MSQDGDGRAGRRVSPRMIAGLVVLVIVVVFAAVNSQTVEIDFVGTSVDLPLVLVILAAFLLGALADRLLIVIRRRRQRH